MGTKAHCVQFIEACPALKMTTVLARDPRISFFLWMEKVLNLLALPGLFKGAEGTKNTILLLFLEVLLKQHHPERTGQLFGGG
jgi:hypothetical protein